MGVMQAAYFNPAKIRESIRKHGGELVRLLKTSDKPLSADSKQALMTLPVILKELAERLK